MDSIGNFEDLSGLSQRIDGAFEKVRSYPDHNQTTSGTGFHTSSLEPIVDRNNKIFQAELPERIRIAPEAALYLALSQKAYVKQLNKELWGNSWFGLKAATPILWHVAGTIVNPAGATMHMSLAARSLRKSLQKLDERQEHTQEMASDQEKLCRSIMSTYSLEEVAHGVYELKRQPWEVKAVTQGVHISTYGAKVSGYMDYNFKLDRLQQIVDQNSPSR